MNVDKRRIKKKKKEKCNDLAAAAVNEEKSRLMSQLLRTGDSTGNTKSTTTLKNK
jgi:hypothetical protein